MGNLVRKLQEVYLTYIQLSKSLRQSPIFLIRCAYTYRYNQEPPYYPAAYGWSQPQTFTQHWKRWYWSRSQGSTHPKHLCSHHWDTKCL
ncbi:unnamed protein product [Blepharisma stoltei]|uniref:Uncharacterized protein n=1 Tax=Blepharisma stoltei TaxID=1481888 RepID=A0AAU9IUC3_9CILI|nr:unnamed protein product [Blepharisma stoltei]